MDPKEPTRKGFIFVISGPSGSGKTTLLDTLLTDRKLKRFLVKSISLTTRPQRTGEKNKKHYFFVTEQEFKQARKDKTILEWTRYLGYYYATPKPFIQNQFSKGKHVILCLDIKGALRLKRIYPKNTVTIFIIPPSLEALRKRICSRCNKTKKEEIKKRLALAKQELVISHKYDYCLVNKNLTQAVKRLREIILEKTDVKLPEAQ